jgi:uncharacterized protein (DUF2141 family)
LWVIKLKTSMKLNFKSFKALAFMCAIGVSPVLASTINNEPSENTAACTLTAFTSTTNATCVSASGSATVTPAGGVAPYTYLWDNGAVTATATNLVAGTYTVVVTDDNGDFVIAEATVAATSVTITTVTPTTTNSACGASTGSASINPNNGTAPYSYAWNNGSVFQTNNNISAGLYSVTITDANGCTGTVTGIKVNNPNAPTIDITAIQDASCQGVSDGSATASVSGGTAPYVYQWSNGAMTLTANNLSVGTYTFTAIDAASCTNVTLVTINQTVVPAPTGDQLQTFCGGVTLNDLIIDGNEILWYDQSSSGNGLSNTEVVSDGVTYYASQTVNGCESAQRLGVEVQLLTITDANLTPSTIAICESGSAIITVENSEVGVTYFLKNPLTNEIVDGPLSGTGANLDLVTGNLTSTSNFTVYAERENPTLVNSTALQFTGNAGLKKVSLGTTMWNDQFAGKTTFTIEAWVNRSTTGSLHTIASNYNSSYPILFRIDNDFIRLFVNTGTFVTGTTILNTGVWYHVAGVYDGTDLKVYVNGQLESSVNYSIPLTASSNELRIGGGIANNTEYFPGDITEVRMWNIARSDAEISANYNKQLTGNEMGLIGYYQFNENMGTVAYNSAVAGSQYDGQIINNPVWVDGPVITNANCYLEMSQNVEIAVGQPVTVDILSNVNACGAFELPVINSGEYFSSINGGGNNYLIGDEITASQTIYIYAADGGCTDESSFEITIDTPVSADILQDETACGNYILSDLTVGDYFTSTNGGGDPVTQGASITTSQTIYIYAVNGLCSDESSFDVTINSFPVINLNQNGVIITAVQSGAQYQWLDCENGFAEITGAVTQSYTASANGEYAVAINLNGCIDTTLCVAINNVGILENTFNEDMRLYPNPTNGQLFIEFTQIEEEITVSISSIAGQLIDKQVYNGTNYITTELNTSAGMYFIRIENERNQYAVIKVMKQ